ncbi:hypothetical protein AB0J80_19860 [Actinoplanes sp. NPDC049548]|uniref:hypothetical protein n=1 Tax=Actinoplanes sp. NPDC049548 TaxID=3155152 RepID=UPI003412877F
MITAPALAAAAEALRGGRAVVLPSPAPLTSAVAAVSAATVNEAKGRPAHQPVATWTPTDALWARLAPSIALDAAAVDRARVLLVSELVTLLVPVRHVPPWMAPAVCDGYAMLFGGCWEPLLPMFDGIDTLHVSSANRTGEAPAASAAEARRMFPDAVHVLDGDDGHPAQGRAATTTLRLAADGTLAHTRRGVQDRAYGGPEQYLTHLRATYGFHS